MQTESIASRIVAAVSNYPVDNPAFVRALTMRIAELAGQGTADYVCDVLAQFERK